MTICPKAPSKHWRSRRISNPASTCPPIRLFTRFPTNCRFRSECMSWWIWLNWWPSQLPVFLAFSSGPFEWCSRSGLSWSYRFFQASPRRSWPIGFRIGCGARTSSAFPVPSNSSCCRGLKHGSIWVSEFLPFPALFGILRSFQF